MGLTRKSGTPIEIHGPLKADDLDLDDTADKWMATYKYEVTGMGPMQDTVNPDGEDGKVMFTVAAGDTSSQIASKALIAVNADIAAG